MVSPDDLYNLACVVAKSEASTKDRIIKLLNSTFKNYVNYYKDEVQKE